MYEQEQKQPDVRPGRQVQSRPRSPAAMRMSMSPFDNRGGADPIPCYSPFAVERGGRQKPNQTGIPSQMKAQFENSSGFSYVTGTGEKVVYGTELHEVLEVKTPYKDWSERKLKKCDAIAGEDFEAAQICALLGQSRKMHIIKLGIAKEKAMLERIEIGKSVPRHL